MTDRAAKLTRLPIMFLRNRPSFFSSCCRMPCRSDKANLSLPLFKHYVDAVCSEVVPVLVLSLFSR